MNNFWKKLKKPIFTLAPMDDVTDAAFRRVVLGCARPDVFFTEFVSVEGLCSEGFAKVATRLKFSPKERPIVAQIWGVKPENYFKAAQMIKKMGFDGIDINMGCPDKSVRKIGGGSGLINNPELAKEVFLATRKGAGGLPVSIKTRIGDKKIETEEWIGFLLKLQPDALTVHGRTVKEMSKVPTHWEEIGKVVKMRDELKIKTLIFGNGDVNSYQEGLEKCQKYNLDGVMIGRGIFHNLWIFNPKIDSAKITSQDRLKILLEHVSIFDEIWGETKNFAILKKFFKAYVNDFNGAVSLRTQLMETNSPQEVNALLKTRENRGKVLTKPAEAH